MKSLISVKKVTSLYEVLYAGFHFFSIILQEILNLKQTAVILLLILLFLQTGGYYLIFSFNILEAKRDALNFIENADKDYEHVTTLTFPIKEGKLMAQGLIFNDEDEFTYQGRMYDVISSEKSKDHITFRCYTDNKETELTQNVRDKIDSDKDAPAQKQKGTFFLKIVLQHTPVCVQQFCFYIPISSAYSVVYYYRPQPFIYRTIVSPPPEYVLA